MKFGSKFIILFLLCATFSFGSNGIIKKGKEIYFANKVVIKLKKETGLKKASANRVESVKTFLAKKGITQMKRRFPSVSAEETLLNDIYIVDYNSPIDPKYYSDKLSLNEDIEWAEPFYLSEITFVPNDPQLATQYALTKVEAAKAWDINKGNKKIIIAIVDSGVDIDHPDLAGNIWTNDDPVNGVDDDRNGYVDDIHGWDFGGLSGTPDNDPTEDSPTHGTHVAGIASAVTNNAIGVAGLGYNCTIMPIKTSQHDIGDRTVAYGYAGILYAVENGADIINCSWGGYSYSKAAQEIIDYAVSKGVVVIASAGNEAENISIYPGAYKGVLSVGFTNSTDSRSSMSNYGLNVDVMAPGVNILNTWQDDTYTYLSGSSMASPLVAGLAGLVKEQFPGYSPLQISEQIRATCDDIDDLNSFYAKQLGKGRVNAYRALTETNAKSARISDISFTDEGNGNKVFEPGEIVRIDVSFINYLTPLSGLSVTLSTSNPNVEITSASFSAGAIGMMKEISNSSAPFRFKVKESAPKNEVVRFVLDYKDGSYTDHELVDVLINPSYKTHESNNIQLSVGSNGSLGFIDYPTNTQGAGFKYDEGANLMFEGGFLLSTGATKVVGPIRGGDPDKQPNEFTPTVPFTISVPGKKADEQGYAKFNDSQAGLQKIGVEVELNTFAYPDVTNGDYIILQYSVKNTTDEKIEGLYGGLYFDWDIDEEGYETNKAEYVSSDKYGRVYNSKAGALTTQTAVALLSEAPGEGFYAFHNDGNGGGIGIYDGFTFAEKYSALSSGFAHSSAGPADISALSSAGPYSIEPNEKIEIAFAIAAGSDPESLKKSISASREKYSGVVSDTNDPVNPHMLSYRLDQNYPNPFNPETKITYSLAEPGLVSIKVYNILGQEIATLLNKEMPAGENHVPFNGAGLSSGLYIYKITSGNYTASKKMMLIK